jgi:hypothetical protein
VVASALIDTLATTLISRQATPDTVPRVLVHVRALADAVRGGAA